jgi:hypothetical protein
VTQGDALASPAPSENDEPGRRGDVERDVVQDFACAEGFRDAIETDRRTPAAVVVAAQPLNAFPGKMKKISRTRMTFDTMMSIDERTTARVDARPTPSVPDCAVNPRYDDTVAMMKPNTIVFSVAGT